ncbi:MAG: hypothetical protein C0514_05700 [Candidatus Puniceispirillum sp.]|nr:hypothetical protein [Candidatus Puniceispirillum sp.]
MPLFTFVLALFTLSASPVLSSLQEAHQDVTCVGFKPLLPKSLNSFVAFLKRDMDFDDYLMKIKNYLDGENEIFEPSDDFFWKIKSVIASVRGRHAWYKKWITGALETNRFNTQSVCATIGRIASTTSPEELPEVFKDMVNARQTYLNGRIKGHIQDAQNPQEAGLPVTLPVALAGYGPVSKTGAQFSIDKHALLSNLIKEIYEVLLENDPKKAQMCLASIEEGSVLCRYLQRTLKTLPDPDTCLYEEGDAFMRTILGAFIKEPELEEAFVSTGNATLDRLRKKQAQKKNGETSQKRPVSVQPTQKDHPSSSRPSAATLALIKEDVTRKKKELEEREREKLEKRRQALEYAQNTQRLRSLVLRQDAAHEPDIQIMSDQMRAAKIQELPGKEKTKGIADVSRSQKKKAKKKPAAKSKQTRADAILPQDAAHPKVDAQHQASALRKQLTHFWETKAGLTFTGVVHLFQGFGGIVKEKSGGSSHVTLAYYGQGPKALKHELWRPHGGCNTFGFQTVASLHAYFEACGLKLDPK